MPTDRSPATTSKTTRPPGPDAGPASPLQLRRRAVWTALRRAAVEFNGDNAWDWAAALTYYGMLSIFPGLLVLVSVVGLLHRPVAESLVSSLSQIAPGPVRKIITDVVHGLQESSGTAGLVAVFGLAVALWSASGYAAAFMRAANATYDVPEGRPLWKTLPIRLGITVATGLLLVASAAIVVLSGGLATVTGRALGLETTTVAIWSVVKWPVLAVLIMVLFAVLYWASPNARQGGIRWVSPGGLVAVLLWIAASVGFGVYVTHFASYDKTYGTLAGVVVFLVWLWISNLALLFGLELNAELERQRAIAAGLRPDAEPFLQLRDDRAVSKGDTVDPSLADRGFESGTGRSAATAPADTEPAKTATGETAPAGQPQRRPRPRVPLIASAFAAGALMAWVLGRGHRR